MAKTPHITLRLDADLAEWAKQYAGSIGMTRTDLIRDCFQALREGRLVELPETPQRHIHNGKQIDFPVWVCLSPE